MSEPVVLLDLDDLLSLSRRLLGDPPPVRDVGLLASAATRPQTTVGGRDAYPTLCGKAAALLRSIVTDHALVDGDGRLGWLATAVVLEINGASVATASNDAVYELVTQRVAVLPCRVRGPDQTRNVVDARMLPSPCERHGDATWIIRVVGGRGRVGPHGVEVPNRAGLPAQHGTSAGCSPALEGLFGDRGGGEIRQLPGPRPW